MADKSSVVWRLYNTDGVPSSGAHKPEKLAVQAWGENLEEGIEKANRQNLGAFADDAAAEAYAAAYVPPIALAAGLYYFNKTSNHGRYYTGSGWVDNNGPGYIATSATSLAIGTGNKTFDTQAGLAYRVGDRVRIASTADATKYMDGAITDYTGTSMTVNVDTFASSGTFASWNIGLVGMQGPANSINWTSNVVRVRSTANVVIASALENGDTLNGVTLATGNVVFLGSQTDPKENGLYTVVASGAASRATFADSAAELARIGFVIQAGTVGAGEGWTLAMDAGSITLGTTALNFSLVPGGPSAEVITARGAYPALNDRLNAADANMPLVADTEIFSKLFNRLKTMGGGDLKAFWWSGGPETQYNGGPAITRWTDIAQGLNADLHTTLYTANGGIDPRPKRTANGMYFAHAAGLTVANGILTATDKFCIVGCFNFNPSDDDSYATLADQTAAAGGAGTGIADGRWSRVTADANTVYNPDWEHVVENGLSDAELINGYQFKSNGGMVNSSLVPFFQFNGSGGAYLRGLINKQGQLICTMYAGTGGPITVSTAYQFPKRVSGNQVIVLENHPEWGLRLTLNGTECDAVGTAIANITSFSSFWFNGSLRSASVTNPINGIRHNVQAFGVLQNHTFEGMRMLHDTVAAAFGTPVLDVPPVAYGMDCVGQSWSQASIDSSADTWTDASGWNGMSSVVYPGKSKENINTSEELLPRVRATKGDGIQNYDIGPLVMRANNLGVAVVAQSHKMGTHEAYNWGLMKQIISHPKAERVDWTLVSSYQGGASIATLSAESNPKPAVQTLRSHANGAGLTGFEFNLQGIDAAARFHRRRGQRFVVKFLYWLQGHSDPSNANYVADLQAYYDKYNAAVKALLNQTEDVIMTFPQIGNSAGLAPGVGNRSNESTWIDQKLLDAVNARGSNLPAGVTQQRPWFCLGPRHMITNHIHNYALGYRWMGEQDGKIDGRILWDGEDWQPFCPKTVTWGANFVDIVFNVPRGIITTADTNDNNVRGRINFDGVDTYGLLTHRGPKVDCTISIASPAVITQAGHPYQNGDKVCFVTTQSLPTGLSVGVPYFVVNRTAGSYQVSLTNGGTAINTSGTQAGTHSAYNVSNGITSISINTGTKTIRVNFAGATASGDAILNTGYACRWSNFVDQDPAVAFYKDLDWTQPLVGGYAPYAEGNLNDLRNWMCAFYAQKP